MTMKLIKDSVKLETLITSISKRGKELDTDIHLAACSCLQHAMPKELGGYGDNTIATHLVAAMPKSSRRLALIDWFVAHGKLAFKKGDKFGMNVGKSKVWDLEKAMEAPFWTNEEIIKPAPDLSISALVKMVKNRISNAQNEERLEDGFTIARFEAKLKGELAELAA